MKATMCILLLASATLSAQQPSPKPSPTLPSSPAASGRYQLIPALLDDAASTPLKTVFLLDTQTGKVWKYQEAFTLHEQDGTTRIMPATFVSVDIGAPSL